MGILKSPALAGFLGHPLEAVKTTMLNLFGAGMTLALHLLSPRHDARLQFLLLQIRMLKARLKSDRVVPIPEEKAELLCLGGELNHDISDIIAIVKPETYRKWRTQSRDGKVAKRSGPAGLAKEVKELICRLAKECCGAIGGLWAS